MADLKVGDLLDGTVTKIVNFGAFVRVKDGLEGLIHISELSHQRVAHPGDVVHEGQTLKLKVISLDSERHRLGLSLKQAEEAPARPARERRPRTERGYDTAQAIQEPEGGIDNTLAAAFAQVRQQMAEQEGATGTDETRADESVEAAAIEVPADEPESASADVEAVGEAPADEPAMEPEPAMEAELEPVEVPTASDVEDAPPAEEPESDTDETDAPVTTRPTTRSRRGRAGRRRGAGRRRRSRRGSGA